MIWYERCQSDESYFCAVQGRPAPGGSGSGSGGPRPRPGQGPDRAGLLVQAVRDGLE